MQFNYKFKGDSKVNSTNSFTDINFSPDLNREPTFFISKLRESIVFREAISAMHSVVVSDMRFKPKDKIDYKKWLKSQEKIWLAEIISQKNQFQNRFNLLKKELDSIKKIESELLKPFYDAQRKYFEYLLKNDYDKWFVLDPVITVHPDEIFFECFSQDESSYAKFSCSYEIFKNIEEHSYGTTNIDYSENLYNEFQKIREYKDTSFIIDPSGFEIKTDFSDDFKEEKIDLPDSWIRGFLQISSSMSMDKVTFKLEPIDIYNILLVLKRNREKNSPRSLKFILKPNQPIKIVVEPWNIVVESSSIFQGEKSKEIKVWGRRRLFILERLIPLAKSFNVSLLGSGMPSFWELEMENSSFTLGLSGWSANSWSGNSNFDLMAPRGSVDEVTAEKVFNQLSKDYLETSLKLSKKLNIEKSLVESALGIYEQEGRVLYDMRKDCYRVREISNQPLPIEKLRFNSPQEEKAVNFLKAKVVNISSVSQIDNSYVVEGKILDKRRWININLIIDSDLRLKDAKCSCRFFFHNRLYKGPCEHILALKLKWQKQ